MDSSNLKIKFTSVDYAVLFHSRVLILQKTKRWIIVFSF